ncbi:imidazolonepropionase [Legionella sp. CNM-4043-24]|uniref:imidazolonepropionase n=1 Tax=Legionella sp. CNM-4043-24 TaxID=3421646 RepID=UPI00403A8D54
MTACDSILTHATSLAPDGGQLTNQSIVIADGRIAWCGSHADLPAHYASQTGRMHDCQGNLVTPGLIDCHTHLVYAGQRADEFRQRMNGVTYSEIARQGGGILSTVRQTRAASVEQLIEQSLPRLVAMRSEGVTTVEIKSGYGLDMANEIKMLQVARQLGVLTGVRVRTTFLGAHAVPPEFKNKSQDYVDHLCAEVLPAIVELNLADALDVFCENIAFSIQETEQLFLKAQELGLPIKCHAEQLSCMGASALAASLGALSCEHLEFLDRAGAEAMARQGSVAVLLPGAFYFLRETRLPPIALLRELGVGMAIATDCNPGSSPTTSLLLMMSMACRFFGMTVPEVLTAVSTQAARALGLQNEVGRIETGMAADLICWSINDSSALCYYFAYPIAQRTMIAGQWIMNEQKEIR